MEVPPLRSGSGPVKVGYEKNSDGSDLVLPSGEVRAVLEMGVMGWLVKSGQWTPMLEIAAYVCPAWSGLGQIGNTCSGTM